MGADRQNNPLWDKELDTEAKLDWLLAQLTTDEKLHMLASGSKGVERLDIPDMRLGGEAAHGVEARNDQNGIGEPDITTSFPQPIGMSSSWDREAIKEAGRVTGREARIVYYKRKWGGISRWAPTVDLLRDPRWGRNEEAYGEDPVQAGNMAASYVRGIQGEDKEHLMAAATLKHFYANNTEIGRGWKNASISPRNKYELYLEPFRRCIEDGGAEGVMTAYNRINGVQGLFNEEVRDILKAEYGLTHAVSDGGAMELSASFSHATAMDAETVARSLKAGVDALSGRPDGVYEGAAEAYELGLLSEEDLDTAIRNVYHTKIRLGLFNDATDKEALGDTCSEEAHKACKALTDSALVLLKNDGMLPLDEEAFNESVLIGPVGDKWYQDWYGGAAPEHVTLKDGINNKRKEAVNFTDACDRISLRCGDRYLSADGEGHIQLSDKMDTYVLEDWGEGSYTLRDVQSGKYMITVLADDPVAECAEEKIAGRVNLGTERIFSWFDLEVFRMDKKDDGKVVMSDRFGKRLYADKDGRIISSKSDHSALTKLEFTVETHSCGIKEAVKAAAGAKNVILALGHSPMVNAKEEVDRATINFIPYQQRLFDEIYKVNPNITVVLMSDYPYAINGINEKAKAILWSSTGSQCMGQSIADALCGSVHPAGRLTQTWYKSDADLPDIDDYDIIGGERTYRFFTRDVLYPFGYGLTYTGFDYSELELSVVQGSVQEKEHKAKKRFGQPGGVYDKVRSDGRMLMVDLLITNVGDFDSDEVIQVYARIPKNRRKQLIGFERIKNIAAGEARSISLEIPLRELAFYDVVRESLIIEKGTYEISVAASSAAAETTMVSGLIDIDGDTVGLRDLTKKIKADHYDRESGSQLVEGLFGFTAVTAAGLSVYDANANGRFSAEYDNCAIPADTVKLRIHGCAEADAALRIFIDEVQAGSIRLNTHDHENNVSEARNLMPRAVEDEKRRRYSFPLLWADIRIPLDLSRVADSDSHVIRIEADGPFKYDWFTTEIKKEEEGR